MKRILLPSTALFILLILNCTQAQTLTIRSAEKDKEIYKGREISYKDGEEIKTEIEVDNVRKGKISFYIYLKNISGHTLEIAPEDIYIECFNDESDVDNARGEEFNAVDPEKVLDDIKKDMDETDNMKDAATGVNAFLSIFGLAVHASEDKHYGALDAIGEVVGFAARQAVIEHEYRGEMKELHLDKEFWKDKVLRRTVLKEGEEIGGIVIIPFSERTRCLKVHIPFDTKDHSYLFNVRMRRRK